MGEWVLRICAIGLITSIVLLILPQGKISKFIKGIFAMYIAVSIFSPLINLDFSSFSFDTYFENTTVNPDEEYLNYFYQNKIDKKADEVEKILSSIGILNADVRINYDISDQHEIIINKIEINLYDAVFNSNEMHKDIIEDARKITSDYFLVEEKVVVVNE